MSTFYDDGNWKWNYECKYVTPSNNPKDYSYLIAFETKDGGYLSHDEITCLYWKTKNKLQIIRKGIKIDFYVENFHDIKTILKPMI